MINNYDTVTLTEWTANKVDEKSCNVQTAKTFPVKFWVDLENGENLVGDLKPSDL